MTEMKMITKITQAEDCPILEKSQISNEQLSNDYNYYIAQKLAKAMLDKGLISVGEFNKISEKNRQSFSPYLAIIMS